MRRSRVLAALACLATLAAAGGVAAAPPQRRIPYQGRLEGASGSTTFEVRLFADPAGASLLWGPESHAVTLDADGRFALTIGSTQLDLCSPSSPGSAPNLVANPSADLGLASWAQVTGTWALASTSPAPPVPRVSGSDAFWAQTTPAELWQIVDLTPFAGAIDQGTASVAFSVYYVTTLTGGQNFQVVVDYLDAPVAGANVIASFDSGTVNAPGLGSPWLELTDERIVPAGARGAVVRLLVPLASLSFIYFDDVSLGISAGGEFDCSTPDGVPDLDQIDPRSLYLEITPSGGVPLLPRQALLPAPYAATSEPAIPVGGMAYWWGSRRAIPFGFELCDGSSPQTPDASLAAAKPDARGRFLRGAPSGVVDVASAPTTGGTDVASATTSSAVAITQAQIPSFSLTSGIPILDSQNHTHSVSHSCVSSDSSPDVSYILGDGVPTTSCPTVFTSSDGSHGHSVSVTFTFGGSNQTHNHSIPSQANLPAYAEMLCIIRVR